MESKATQSKAKPWKMSLSLISFSELISLSRFTYCGCVVDVRTTSPRSPNFLRWLAVSNFRGGRCVDANSNVSMFGRCVQRTISLELSCHRHLHEGIHRLEQYSIFRSSFVSTKFVGKRSQIWRNTPLRFSCQGRTSLTSQLQQ